MHYAHPKSEWGQVKGEKRGKGRIIPEKYKHDSFVKLYFNNSNQLSSKSPTEAKLLLYFSKLTRKMRGEILVDLFLFKSYWSQDHCELCSFLTAFSG